MKVLTSADRLNKYICFFSGILVFNYDYNCRKVYSEIKISDIKLYSQKF